MTKDDLCGIAGVALSALVGWYDVQWRVVWWGAAILLSVWTAWSLCFSGNRNRDA